jgi:hypothetical protein
MAAAPANCNRSRRVTAEVGGLVVTPPELRSSISILTPSKHPEAVANHSNDGISPSGHFNEVSSYAAASLSQPHARTDHRFTFEHDGISTPEQARRMKTLGGIANADRPPGRWPRFC